MKSVVTVTEPATTFDLTVLEAVKLDLKIAQDDASQDALLTQYIHQVSGAIASYCRRVFARETVTELFWADGPAGPQHQPGRAPLILTRSPVASIDGVSVDGALVDPALYRLDDASGLLFRLDDAGNPRSWHFSKSISVDYAAGYQLVSGLPYEVERAAIIWVGQSWFAAGRDPLARSVNVPGVIEESFWVESAAAPGVPREVVDLLAPYRNLVVG